MENSDSGVNADKKPSRDHSRNTEIMQDPTDKDQSDVWNKFVVENASEVSFSTTIKAAFRSSSQQEHVLDHPKRTEILREMERTKPTSLIAGNKYAPRKQDNFSIIKLVLIGFENAHGEKRGNVLLDF